MIKMVIELNNRREYRVMNSVWAACMIGCAMIRENPEIKTIFVVNSDTYELLKQIKRD